MYEQENIPLANLFQLGSRKPIYQIRDGGTIMEKPALVNLDGHAMFGGSDIENMEITPEEPKIEPVELVGEIEEEPTLTQTKKGYNIINLFWLYNQKLFDKKPLLDNETHFATISFNCNFGNLRVDLFEIPPEAIKGHVVFLNLLKRKISGTIYPGSLFRLLYEPSINMTCMEQLVTYTGEDWQSQRPVCKFMKNDHGILLTIDDHMKNSHLYNFTGWQREAFIYAAKFALNQGFQLVAQNNM
jgi:hypothetical protein